MSSINTSPHLNPLSLQRLGLMHAHLGKPVRVPRRRRVSAAEHVRSTQRRTTDELDFSSPNRGSRPAIEIGGLWMRACAVDEGDVFVLKAGDGDRLHVEASGRGETPWSEDPADPSRVYIEPIEDAAFAVARGDGTGVVIVHEKGKGIYAYHFEPDPQAAPEPPARARRPGTEQPLSCPAPQWLSDDDETWLHQLVQTRVARGGLFNFAVAVGVAMRLRVAGPEERAQGLAALLSGRPMPTTHAPHDWYRALDAEQRQRIESAGVSHVNALHDAFGDLRNGLDIDAARWRDRLLAALHVRDDLEGLRSLALAVGEGEMMLRSIARLDREVGRFVCSLPRPVGLVDERLVRVASLDPGAWWASMVRAPA